MTIIDIKQASLSLCTVHILEAPEDEMLLTKTYVDIDETG